MNPIAAAAAKLSAPAMKGAYLWLLASNLVFSGGATSFGTSPVQWPASVTVPTIGQATPTSDVPTQSINITSQAPYASAATNLVAGNINLNIPAPVSGNPDGTVQFTVGTTKVANFGYATNSAGTPTWWLGVTPAGNNWTLQGDGSTYISLNAPLSTAKMVFQLAQTAASAATLWSSGLQLFHTPNSSAFGGGGGVIGLSNATVLPTTSPTGGLVLYSATGALSSLGTLLATTTVASSGSAGTVNSQHQVFDIFVGTAETVSTATATSLGTYSTLSGSGGQVVCNLVSRATTTGTGIAVGDTSASTYVFSYRNIAGTVTISTAGPTLVAGTNQTTAAALTAPVLTTTVATSVITLKVTNVALDTIDSQVDCQLSVN